MEALAESIVFWVVCGVQAAGLLALVVFRFDQRAGSRMSFLLLFLLSLGLVGAAAIFSLATGSGSWAASVATLSVMCVGAVLDTGLAPTSTEMI